MVNDDNKEEKLQALYNSIKIIDVSHYSLVDSINLRVRKYLSSNDFDSGDIDNIFNKAEHSTQLIKDNWKNIAYLTMLRMSLQQEVDRIIK